jgi:tRNA dimethylallyltransferase
MNIGTAKPTPQERAAVAHHLIDVTEPVESFSVGRYVSMAQEVAADLESQGKAALFVGGTPLYLKALVSGLFDGPPADAEFRAELEARASRLGAAALHEELGRIDPASAARIHPNDLKRIVRALEVFHTTGRRLSEQQTQWSNDAGADDSRIAGLAWDRAELYRRIEARVERMFAEGLVDEVRALVEKYGRLGREASQALGYKEVLAHLAGSPGLAETIALVKRNTRRMAKRQLTWFRSFERIRWFAIDQTTPAAEAAAEIAGYFNAP